MQEKRCDISKQLSLRLLYRRISFFSPSISRTFTHTCSSSKRSLHVFLILPCMPSTSSISQSPRRMIPPKLNLSSLGTLGDRNKEQCCLRSYVASEAAGSNADDPSWLELVPWRNKQLATRMGAAVWEPANCNTRFNTMMFSASMNKGKSGSRRGKGQSFIH